MKTLKIVLFLILMPVAAHAGAKKNALHHFAQAIAAANLCSRIEVNEEMIALAAVYNHIDMKAEEAALQADIRDQMQAFSGKDPELACMAGLMLYGPNGSNVPGLVRER